jgi:hypothetical protein
MKNGTKLSAGQMIVKSIDTTGRTVDAKLFDSGVRGLKKLFGRTDDLFSVEMYLVDEGLDQDIATDIVYKHF